MEISSAHNSWLAQVGHVCEYASAIFGIFGTALMSRRFVPKILLGVLFSATYPLMFLFRQGHRVRQYLVSRASLNEDLKDSPGDMTLGMILLFWAFFLQLISLLLK
jgi:hypothetical protein